MRACSRMLELSPDDATFAAVQASLLLPFGLYPVACARHLAGHLLLTWAATRVDVALHFSLCCNACFVLCCRSIWTLSRCERPDSFLL